MKEYKTLSIFCGIGGQALGFQAARAEYRGMLGMFRVLAGIDCDPEACQDFEALTGAPAVQMDLFSRKDYIAFHGQEPPADWREVTALDLLEASQGEYPDVVFMSPPCKGFSGLLPSEKSKSEKYQALNRLVVRGLQLVLDAYAGDLPAVIMLENVPRITSRGKFLLKQVINLLGTHGYVFHPDPEGDGDGYHDCGELGGLAQHRKRYLLIARLPEKMSSFICRPHKKRVKAIGEVIGPLSMPDDPAMGPMHRLPRLQWKTWVRLALIPAGGDWRDLENCGRYNIEPVPWNGAFRIKDWNEPSGVVTGQNNPNKANISIADPRINHVPREGVYKVQNWNEPSTTVTGAARVNTSNGSSCIADPRLNINKDGHKSLYQVVPWHKPSRTITGARGPNNGAITVADPRLSDRQNRRNNSYMVRPWESPAHTITGEDTLGSGAQSIADPRVEKFNHSYKVTSWKEPAGTVTSGGAPSNGAVTVADPRLGCKPRNGSYGVQDWEQPAGTVIGTADVHAGTAAIADPRITCQQRSGTLGVTKWNNPSPAVAGHGHVGNSTVSIADPRIPADNERPDPPPVIIALDGTRHRPLTTLELAALQGFPVVIPDGHPLTLSGKSDARWRERIGNAVPPPTAEAIGEEILLSFLASEVKEEFRLTAAGIWVVPDRHLTEMPEVI
jgi:site-specific DNA-cytosine methylase